MQHQGKACALLVEVCIGSRRCHKDVRLYELDQFYSRVVVCCMLRLDQLSVRATHEYTALQVSLRELSVIA